MLRPHDPFRRAQAAIAALFWCLGFQYATWASRIPALKAHLGLTAAQVGLLLMATGAGAAASFPLVAALLRRLGSRRLSLLAAAGLALLLPLLAAAPGYPAALAVMCGDGVLVGCLNAAMNAQGAALEAAHGRTTMARLHATFSGGSLCAALVASAAGAVTSSLAAHFATAALLLLLLAGYARGGLLTDDHGASDVTEKTVSRRRWTMPSRMVLWMGWAMAFGTVTEGAMNDWSALYLKDVAGAPAALAPMGIAVVSVMMVLARLFADGWRARWGDGRVVRAGSAVAAAGLALALLSGGVVPALLGFACVGLGIAAVTPCVYVAAAARGSDALTLVAAMGTTGLLAGPPVIGFVANAGGLVWGLAAVSASAAVVSLCGTRIRWPSASPSADRSPEAAPAQL